VIGQSLGPYQVVGKLGEGGMGQVYRARDPRLQRDVAIKVLPQLGALDRDRRTRFVREAQVLAALNHPHIAGIYGWEESASGPAIVMELVEGQTLADRIARGPVPMDEALEIARQIASALEAAHDQGIVHRDLKPANVSLRSDGTVKVLDFGVAKALSGASSGISADDSPTVAVHGTEVGVLVGTAAYMAPEQARGRDVDKRADLWAFGVVLFETISGRRPFEGATISDTIAAVLRADIDWSALPGATPPGVRRLLRRCLERDASRRLRDAGDARLEIEEIGETDEPRQATPRLRRERAVAWALALLAGTLAIAVWATGGAAGDAAPAVPLHVDIQLSAREPLATRLGSNLALSPDGRTLLFLTTDQSQPGPSSSQAGSRGITRLHVRNLDRPGAVQLAGIADARAPFFSPDGQWVGFFSAKGLMKVGIAGGAPELITAQVLDRGRGASWGAGDQIVYSPGFSHSLWRVSASGGTPAPLTSLDASPDERSHRWPSFLPGGRAVLFMVQRVGADWDDADIEAVSLADGRRKVLVRGGAYPRYVAGGWLAFVRHGVLYALPLDADRLEVGEGPARPVLHNVMAWTGDQETGDGSAEFAVADNGTFVYRRAQEGEQIEGTPFFWVDRTGRETPAFRERFRALGPEISPDGRYVAIDGRSAAGLGVWIRELDRGAVVPLSVEGAGETQPIWSPDGRQLAYAVRASGAPRVMRIRAPGGSEAERTLPSTLIAAAPSSWLPDGRILVTDYSGRTRGDVYVVDADGAGAPEVVVRSPGEDAGARVSPNGKWLLYFSDESGTHHVYARPAAAAGPRVRVSTERGTQPRWSRDGTRVYFVQGSPTRDATVTLAPGDALLMEVPVSEVDGTLRLGAARVVYQGAGLIGTPGRAVYDVHPDGRLLVIRRELSGGPEDTSHVTLVTEFPTLLQRVVSAGQ
jgi:serine/threonine-protein kinase